MSYVLRILRDGSSYDALIDKQFVETRFGTFSPRFEHVIISAQFLKMSCRKDGRYRYSVTMDGGMWFIAHEKCSVDWRMLRNNYDELARFAHVAALVSVDLYA